MAISLFLPKSQVDLYNVYNPPDTDLAYKDLQAWLQSHPLVHYVIWVGDFNKHHPLWTGPDHPERCHCSHADLLIHLIIEHDLEPALLPGTYTYESEAHYTWSMLDLFFMSSQITQ
jgi:hypothetical protein